MSRIAALSSCLLAALVLGCDDGGSADPDAAPTPDSGPVPDSGPALDRGVQPDVGLPPAVEAVSGELTYVVYEEGGGHIYSVQANGELRRRVTLEAAPWAEHAVGPDPRYIAALRYTETIGEGRPNPEATAEVWIIDVLDQRSWPLSPPGCDAAGGGIGWRNDALVMFAARCDDGPAVAYLYPFDEEGRDPGLLLPITNHEGDVADVFPVVNTAFFAYTVSSEVCDGGRCVQKPAIWIGDAELATGCPLTDGDPEMTDTSTIDGGPRILGDHAPAFTGDLSGMLFSRNVAGKPAGRGGHFDAFRVDIDPVAYSGRAVERCDQGGTLINLADGVFDDRFVTIDQGEAIGNQRGVQPGAGSRVPVGAVLMTGQTFTPAGATSAIWVYQLDGTRRAVTSPTGWADHGRWIVDDYALTGER